MMDVLPSVPVILLAIVAAWFFWPLIADPITGRKNAFRDRSNRSSRETAEDLFKLWPEQERP